MTTYRDQIIAERAADPELPASEIARLIGCTRAWASKVIALEGLPTRTSRSPQLAPCQECGATCGSTLRRAIPLCYNCLPHLSPAGLTAAELKAHRAVYDKQYYKRHRARILAYQARYRKAHPLPLTGVRPPEGLESQPRGHLGASPLVATLVPPVTHSPCAPRWRV